MLEKTLESPLDSKEIKPVNPKENQSWIFFGRTEAETPILWPLDEKNWLIWKDLMLGQIEGKRRRGWQRIVGWHCWLDEHEFEQAPGIADGQGSLVCYSPWGHKESDMTEWLNWTELRMSPGNRITQFHGKSYSMNMSFACFSSFQLFGNKISYLKFLGLPHAGTFF